MSAKVTVEHVQRVAELAHLELTPAEGSRRCVTGTSSRRRGRAERVDTSNVAPLAQMGEVEGGAIAALRADQVRPSLERSAVMSQAPETDNVFFKVPKVIER